GTPHRLPTLRDTGPGMFDSMWRSALLAIALLLGPGAVLHGQTSSVIGRTSGPGGVTVPAVSILLLPDAGPPRTTLSAEDGSFRFDAVAPGAYTLRTSRLGFAEREQRIELAAGQTL